MSKARKNYHDYVIKDGEFIGEFEEMYKDCEDPWMQSEQPNKYSRMAGILHLKNFNIKSVLECGCGLGYYADWIHKDTGIIPKSVDVSVAAIEKARELFPELDFEVADITKELSKFSDLDCVMFSEIVWYILPDIDSLLVTLQKDFKGKYLIVNQVFYKGSQKYGTEYFTSLNEFIDYVPFKLVGRCEATLEHESTIETSSIFEIG
ncbi:MAG TPA: nodulation protein S NodS [Flavobacteriales bacterium]|mgnify:CR=1 FL=1|jgi:SAM-dependent methyltransferase|nr:nodulation protein S NodS [Flavobacteriales bacterium]